jgi:hypothetical protein
VAQTVSARIERLTAQARRQGLVLSRLPGDGWGLVPLESSLDWRVLPGRRQQLPDGRVLLQRMSLDEVEAFLTTGQRQ